MYCESTKNLEEDEGRFYLHVLSNAYVDGIHHLLVFTWATGTFSYENMIVQEVTCIRLAVCSKLAISS